MKLDKVKDIAAEGTKDAFNNAAPEPEWVQALERKSPVLGGPLDVAADLILTPGYGLYPSIEI